MTVGSGATLNTLSGATIDFSATLGSAFKLPVLAGLTTAHNGNAGYDSTSNNWHAYQNGNDSYLFSGPVSGTYNNGDCLQLGVTAGSITLVDAAAACASAIAFQVNGTGLSSASTVNYQNSAATNGLTLTFSNPSAGNIKLGFTGTLTNVGLANSAMTIAGTSVSLGGSTSSFPSPGAIGGGTPSTGAFTTLSATGQFTSTLAIGTAPFSVTSTTVVPNLNVSQLLGGTWAVPGTIGSTTPNSGAFTTLSASTSLTLSAITGSTQCLQVNTSGVVSGAGSACGGSGTVGTGNAYALANYGSSGGTTVTGTTGIVTDASADLTVPGNESIGSSPPSVTGGNSVNFAQGSAPSWGGSTAGESIYGNSGGYADIGYFNGSSFTDYGRIAAWQQSNVWGAFLQNFGSATLGLPSSAAYAPTTAGLIGYDSSNNRLVVGNGTNTSFIPWFTATPTTGQFAQWSGALGAFTSGFPTQSQITPTAVASAISGTVSAGTSSVWFGNSGAGACTTVPASANSFTINLPVNTSQPVSGACINIINYGTGTLTVARNGQNINGGTASLTIPAGSATAPTGAFIVSDGTNYDAALWGSGGSSTPALSSVTGATAQSTITETAAGHQTTFAGVETSNLDAAYSFTNANSTNNNTSLGLLFGVTGSSTGGIGGLVYNVSGTGDLFDGYSGGSVSNGTYTPGTKEFGFTNAGNLALTGALTTGGTSNLCGSSSPCIGGAGGTTAPTATSGDYFFFGSSTNNCWMIYNSTTNNGCIPVGPTTAPSAGLVSWTGTGFGQGTTTLGTGLSYSGSTLSLSGIPIADLATIGANTTVANVTNSTASATAAAIPSGIQNYVAGTGYNQATAHQTETALVCADTSGSGTAQSCTTSPSFTPAASDCVIYTTTTANSGAGLTLAVNGAAAKSVAKWQNVTTLAANDVRASTENLACYDGTNWEIDKIGNAPGGSGTVTSVGFTGGLISVATPTTTPAFTVAGTSGGVPYFSNTSTWASSALLAQYIPVVGGGSGNPPLTIGSAGTVGQFLGSGGASANPSYSTLSAVNPQTATYQVLASDFSGYKTITVASGTFTITLVASGSQPAAGQYLNILNYGSGVVTVARSGQNINGGTTSLTLAAGSATAPTGAEIWSDGTNYFAQPVGATSGGSTTGNGVTNTTPVTVAANSTSDQQLMELALTSAYLNSTTPIHFFAAGLYSTGTAQTPTLQFKVKLCTVSGCGSGTVVTLYNDTTTATTALVTNQPWNITLNSVTVTTGASGTLEIHGNMAVDLGALATTSDTIYADETTAVSSAINLTGLLYLDVTVATSTGNTGNSITQRLGIIAPYASTPTVYSGNTTTAASANANLAGAATGIVVTTDGSGNVQSSGTAISSIGAGSTTEGKDGIWNNGWPATGFMASGNVTTGVPVLGTSYVTQIIPNHNMYLNHVSVYVGGASESGATLYACLYTNTTGGTVWNASTSIATATAAATATGTQYLMTEGTPYIFLIGQFGSSTGATLEVWATQSIPVLTITAAQAAGSSTNPAWQGTAANAVSTGPGCPSSTGALTAFTASNGVTPAALLGP